MAKPEIFDGIVLLNHMSRVRIILARMFPRQFL